MDYEKFTGNLTALSKTVDNLEVLENWISFDMKGYSVHAKVFKSPSNYGINNGRISKMEIKNSKQVLVFSYDRGEGLNPSSKAVKEIVEELVEIFKRGEITNQQSACRTCERPYNPLFVDGLCIECKEQENDQYPEKDDSGYEDF